MEEAGRKKNRAKAKNESAGSPGLSEAGKEVKTDAGIRNRIYRSGEYIQFMGTYFVVFLTNCAGLSSTLASTIASVGLFAEVMQA